MPGGPLEGAIMLNLDGLGIGKINDLLAPVFHRLDGEKTIRRKIVLPVRAPLRASTRAIDAKTPPAAGAHAPVEIKQAVGLKEPSRAGVVAAGHIAVEPAVVVGDPIQVIEFDRSPLLEADVAGQRDQVPLVLHRPQRVLVEVNQQLLAGKTFARRHRHFVAAISPHLHPVRPLPQPDRGDIEPGSALHRRDMPHQQAVP